LLTTRFARIAAVPAALAAWGLYESQLVRRSERDVPIAGLPAALEELRIGHLSDLHVGAPGLNSRALRRGVELVMASAPDLICITGDLRARVSGDADLRAGLRELHAPLGVYAILGNHDHASGHDPFADGVALTELDGTGVILLRDEHVDVVRAGARVRIAGVDPRTFERDATACGRELVAADADLGILLCHFPTVLDRLTPGAWGVVLTGHLHGGQLCIPTPTGKIRLSHRSRSYLEGVYGRDGTVMHLSRGLGTTFVPFRFAARPEVTILRLVATSA
jgi:predicted MPP superfamily phosphohydrolase